MNIAAPFSDWLLEEMRIRNLSQADLSRLTGLTRQTISYYLSGKSKQPDEFALKKIAEAFELPPEEVYKAAGIPVSNQQQNKIVNQISHLTSDLPERDQKEILEFVKLRRRLAEDRGKYETPRAKKPSPTHK